MTASAPPSTPPEDILDPFTRDVLFGLTQTPKQLPAKLFYDQRGSELFDAICTLDEYYLTRTELGILTKHAPEMADVIGASPRVIEFGSGSGLKTRLFLRHLHSPAAYLPIEISQSALDASVVALRQDFPELLIHPVHADYTKPVSLPDVAPEASGSVVFFPGSTLGNFEFNEARAFLTGIRALVGDDGRAIIGVDLKKDPAMLHAAYNDSLGVTAAFNKNVLHRLREQFGEQVNPDHFDHYAFYNPMASRIEMHLVANRDVVWCIQDQSIEIVTGESINTEYSYKYTTAMFRALAADAGFAVTHVWTDARQYFGVFSLEANS